jgi:hypothetical protein
MHSIKIILYLIDLRMYLFKLKANYCKFKHIIAKLITSHRIDLEMIFPCISLNIYYANIHIYKLYLCVLCINCSVTGAFNCSFHVYSVKQRVN